MKRTILYILLALTNSCFVLAQQTEWKIAGDRIRTEWADKVDPANTLPEYPRPHLVRQNWINLNGLWDYSILPAGNDEGTPKNYAGKILVPFAVESALSGVGTTVGKDSVLWYRRSFTVPSKLNNQTILLQFGGVDWRCDVYVNGQKIGTHEGGFDPFSFDITSALKKRGQQELIVRVWDPTDDGPQPRGKQVKNPEGIWYTPVTGIWQTVWLEAVPKTYISSTKHTPDLDGGSVTIAAKVENIQPTDMIRITAYDGSTSVAEQRVVANEEVKLMISNARAWSPATPHLYKLRFTVERGGKVLDEVSSYFAMRKVSIAPDSNGVQRMLLNNEFVFHYGPLDQGWWPDGLYTAPTDAALKFDVEQTKAMGFNMIRKHIKVEPARWYYYCDSIGILVWQDMPSGDLGNRWEPRPFVVGRGTEKKRTPESEGYYRKEWNKIIDDLYNFPSIVVWVPFNEAWGQFKTEEIVEWTVKKDSTRLVNGASGGNYTMKGHIIDMHNYPDPVMPSAEMFGSKHAIVLGEFGGLGLPLEGHTWQQRNWGYQSFGTADSLRMRYEGFTSEIVDLIKMGLSAAVYTQTTDVEGETNGMLTYDRKVFKIPAATLKQMHQKLYNPALGNFNSRKRAHDKR